MATSIELRAIDNTRRDRAQLYAALDLYRSAVRPEEQNPESQILHWIDHREDLKADEFRCFTLGNGSKILGYLQYSYFSEENLFFWEYLCLSKAAIRGLGPNQGVVNALRNHLTENYPTGFTIVFEVAHEKLPDGTRISDRKRIDYFKRLGFRQVDYPYRYPILQTYDGENSYAADLLVLLPDKRKTVSAAELKTILRCLYYKHYLRWDRPFLDAQQFERRQKLIDALYANQVSKIGNADNFPTDGDDRRLGLLSFNYAPGIKILLAKIFGPKLPRLIVVMLLVLAFDRLLNGVWQLVPFILIVAVIYCLAEDTKDSAKILALVLKKLPSRSRS